MPAVALAAVTIAFALSNRASYRAVEAIDLAVAPGEFVAIVGPTGCGKSTLLNVAAGLLAPAPGTVEIFGARSAGVNRRAGYLFQQDAVMPWKTALDNVAVALELAGVAARRGAGAGARLAGARRPRGLRRPLPAQLSGGQRKRVALAQMLIRDPEILLMDEPSARSMRRRAQIMGNLLLGYGLRTARPCCSSPTISRRPSRWPTASSSCRPARRRASSATIASTCRARATAPRSAEPALPRAAQGDLGEPAG